MKAWQQEMLMPSEPYSAEHAQAVAAARVASVPQLTNDALVYLLAGQRGEIDPMVAIAYAVKNLQEVVSAPDALAVEESLCQD